MSDHTYSPDVEEHSAYPEPHPEDDVWPEAWTPKQRTNWERSGQPVYDELETEVGRYWYRRTWRPKMRGDGMKQRDHVKLGTPEDYVAEHVSDTLEPMGNLTGVMMRQFSRFQVNTEDLEDAIEDITQAKISQLSEERQARLLNDANRLANAYGIDGDQA